MSRNTKSRLKLWGCAALVGVIAFCLGQALGCAATKFKTPDGYEYWSNKNVRFIITTKPDGSKHIEAVGDASSVINSQVEFVKVGAQIAAGAVLP